MRYRVLFLTGLMAFAVGLGSHVLGANGQHGEPHGNFASGYEADRQESAFRSSVSVIDTKTVAGILATTEFKVFGKSTIIVGGRFSASAATATIQIAYVYKDDVDPSVSSTSTSHNIIKGFSPKITLTGDSTGYGTTYYPAPDVFFDGEGAVTCRVLITTAVSSGTVDLWVGTE